MNIIKPKKKPKKKELTTAQKQRIQELVKKNLHRKCFCRY
ncbi:hypothetical protein LEP1GSC127_0603 [Leptospira kirschneri str. 200801925]|nr:hypothetical protein LEP1GSC127_0603 [Leptospira kirschneri str. 200801925]